MIELKILVDDIDYNSLTELLVPLLADTMIPVYFYVNLKSIK